MANDDLYYLEKIEEVIENFANIQKQLVLDKKGIQAILDLIKEFSDEKTDLTNHKDPIVDKARKSAYKVIQHLENQLSILQGLTPPAEWKSFHELFIRSIKLQLDGYREMYKAFEDNNPIHVKAGLRLVNEGMNILEAGTKTVQE